MPRYDLMHWSQRVRDQQAEWHASNAYTAPPVPVQAPRAPRSPRPKRPKPVPNPDADHVLHLCREGRLYELEKWVADGGSLNMPADYRYSPLGIALDKGFHSLIEFLLKNGATQAKKDNTLRTALLSEQSTIATLALDCGADPKSVSFFDALAANSPAIVLLFLHNGADPTTDYAFPRAFHAGIRSTLRTFLECRRLRPDLGDVLQEHLDMSLRQACSDRRERLAGLLTWAGANPRARGLATEDVINPTHNADFVSEEELKTTAIQSACVVGSISMLRTFRINSTDDDLSAILCDSVWSPKPELARWLLKRGANPNDKENGGSSALDRCLMAADHPDSYSLWSARRKLASTEITKGFSTFEALVDHGALWKPAADTMRRVRRTLLQLTNEAAMLYLTVLHTRRVCDDVTFAELTRTPAMQAVLRSYPRRSDFRPRTEIRATARSTGMLVTVAPNAEPKNPFVSSKYDRVKLYEQVWAQPTQKVAKEYGVSDAAITKACKRLKIPKPTPGYWNKKAAGHAVPDRPPLREYD